MNEPAGVTALDAKETGTENIIRAIAYVAESRAKLVRQTEDDRVNPEFDDAMRADMIAINDRFLRMWDRSDAILKAELKKRLN